MINCLLLILGFSCVAYDFILILINPGTLWDNIFSFTHIWLLPGLYLIFLAIYRIRTKRSFWSSWVKWFKITFVSILSTGLVIAGLNLYFIMYPEVFSMEQTAENVILLGGGIDKKGKLPESVLSRVEKAAEYLNQHPKAVCVVTGGTLKWLPFAEAPELKNQLVNRGVAPERILVEDQAKDTIENFKFSCKMLAEYRGLSIEETLDMPTAVVTSHYHLRRSERLARRIGFTNIKGIPAACPVIYVPHSYLREICAYVKLNLRIMLTGEPKRLSGQARQ